MRDGRGAARRGRRLGAAGPPGRRQSSGSSPTPTCGRAVGVDGLPLDAPVARARARAGADGSGRAARGRGDGRHARGGHGAPGGARRRATSAACCPPPTCSGSTRAARSRCVTRSSARPTRTRWSGRSEQPPAAVPAARQRAGVPPRDLGRVLSLQHDAVVARLIDFSIWSHGPAPAAVGVARSRERGSPGVHARLRPGQRARVRHPAAGRRGGSTPTSSGSGSDVNAGLVRCGIGLDNNGVLAGKRLWRMSKDAWLRTFDACLREPDESHLIRATVAFDFRPTAGGLAVAAELTARIRARTPAPPVHAPDGADGDAAIPVALGFRGQLATGHDGDPAGPARPQARRDHPARQSGPLPRARRTA